MSVRHPLLTIGHSNLDVATFVGLLQVHDVSVVVDVRSSPFSRYMPEYNRDAIRATLEAAKIQYVFMGVELGARRTEPECYREGMARYDLIAKSPLFQRGLDRLREGTLNYRVALMCAEKDPLTCHRTILICRQLRTEFTIEHILDS
ncbi:MAG: DUF488 domain-containing protein, partial [Planctomycetaceae bacterium]|nr:DUF488 domain-containing protein [Planctomycetaceae bacterium]